MELVSHTFTVISGITEGIPYMQTYASVTVYITEWHMNRFQIQRWNGLELKWRNGHLEIVGDKRNGIIFLMSMEWRAALALIVD